MEKKIGKYWFSWGRTSGFALGFNISKYNWGIELGFWYYLITSELEHLFERQLPLQG
jgi:hypothetical protein